MTTYLQLLSLDTVDSSPSVVVGTETARFLFDSGEGIQRLCVEHRTRIAKLECVYLTRLCPETVGGLPGLSLTSADAGRTQLSITGPVGSSIFWNSTNHFMKRSSFNTSISEPVSSSTTAPTIPSQKFSDMTVHCSCLGQTHLSYICETPKLAGKFDIVKALALKIPKGPLFAKLKSGSSITLEDGTVVKPEQVVDEEIPGRFVSIICCIQIDNDILLNELYSQMMLKRFQFGEDLEGKMDCMVHFSPREVILSPKYQQFMKAFGSSTNHIAAGKNACLPQSSFIAATRYCNKQHLLCPDFFSSMSLQQDQKLKNENSIEKHEYDKIDSKGFHYLENSIEESGSSNNGSIDDNKNDNENSLGGDETFNLRMIRGAALMRYNILPAKSRCLQKHNSLTRDQRNSTNSLSKTDKITDISINGGPEPVESSQDQELVDFWSLMGSNEIIKESLYYAARVRKIAIYENNCEDNVSNNTLQISDNNDVSTIDNGNFVNDTENNGSMYKRNIQNEINVAAKDESMGYPKLQNFILNSTDISPNNTHTVNDETIEHRNIMEDDEKIRIKNKYEFKHNQADRLYESGLQGASVSFLGTGCAVPSKYRNVSGILIHLPCTNTKQRASMLLDAGEGTWQQMVRMAYNNPSLIGLPSTLSKEPYTEASAKNTPQEKISTEAPFKSSAKVNTSIKNPSFKNNTLDSEISVIPPTIEEILARQLQVIWISHPHADHHLGLLTILSERKKLLTTCRNPCNVRERGKGTNAIDSSSGSNGEDAINNEVVSTDIGVSEEGEYGGRPEGETDDGFVPVVLIAPPSVLAFLRDYSLVDKDNLIRGSYIPISSRLFDKKDLCGVGMGDSYWCDPNDDMYNTENTYHNSNKYYNQDRSNYNTKKYDRNNDNDRDLNNKIGINLEHNKNKFGFSSQSASVLHDRVESKPLWYMTAQLHLANGKKLLDKIGIEIENVKVLHCPQAYGVVVTVSLPNRVRVQTPDVITPRKMKIVYSGDTRPSALLCDVGRDCALLIHEATFEDDETGLREASGRRHCTVGEAIQVAKDMNAYRLILTHFSQRYPSVPSIPLEGKDYVLLAFDFMRISFQDLIWAPSVMPALVEAFPPTGNENENDEENEVLEHDAENKGNKKKIENENGKKRQIDNKKNQNSKKMKLACRCHEFSTVDNDDEDKDMVINDIKICSICTLDSNDEKSVKNSNLNNEISKE